MEATSNTSEETTRRAYELTGLDNPNSVVQVKDWLYRARRGSGEFSGQESRQGYLLPDADGEVLEMLKLRLLMSKTSVKKYQAMKKLSARIARPRTAAVSTAQTERRWAGRPVQFRTFRKTISSTWGLPVTL